jgi:hypothetical protein
MVNCVVQARSYFVDNVHRGAGRQRTIMSPEFEQAISKYLSQGGKVAKLPATIPVTASEIVEYLVSKGVAARCTTKAATATYVYKDKPVTLKKLVEAANSFRRKDQLAPFAIRIELRFPAANSRRPPPRN